MFLQTIFAADLTLLRKTHYLMWRKTATEKDISIKQEARSKDIDIKQEKLNRCSQQTRKKMKI